MGRPASILRSVAKVLVGKTRAGRIGRVAGLVAVAGLCGATVAQRRRHGRDTVETDDVASGGSRGDGSDDAAEGGAHASRSDGESADADRLDQTRSVNGSVPGDRRSPLEGSGSVSDPRSQASEADLLESEPVDEDDGEPELPESVPASGSEADILEQLRGEPMDEEEHR